MSVDPVVTEYEVFKNNKNALAFFMYRQTALDNLPEAGPYFFVVHEDKIIAGSETNHAIFVNVKPDIIDLARERGAIMLVEFENQQPYRCTPCYFRDTSAAA